MTFLKVEFVTQDASGCYEPGPLALQLGLARLQRLDPVKEASPLIAALAAETEQSVAVAVWGNLGPIIVRLEEPIHPLHVNLRTGTVMSLAYTATGRLFAAHLPPKVVQKLIIEGRPAKRTLAENDACQLLGLGGYPMARPLGRVLDIQ